MRTFARNLLIGWMAASSVAASAQQNRITDCESLTAEVERQLAIQAPYKEASDKCGREYYRNERPSDMDRMARNNEERREAEYAAVEQANSEDRYLKPHERAAFKEVNYACREHRRLEWLKADDAIGFLVEHDMGRRCMNEPGSRLREVMKQKEYH